MFFAPLERAIGASRGELSLVFSIATVAFTATMYAAPALTARLGTRATFAWRRSWRRWAWHSAPAGATS